MDSAVDKSRTFEGHAQDPPSKLLKRIKTFLADEDPNRCLNFVDDRLPQIEEYIKYVEEENLIGDNDKKTRQLLQEVKTMAEVQRDWISRADAPPVDTTCCDAPVVLNYSTRLQSLETVQKLQEEREQMGLSTHMRDDHAPFTVERSSDQFQFLGQMLKDAQADPDEIDAKDNLANIENRAYNWALSQPPLIPHWMHRTGLPNSGQPRDKTPWNRNIPTGLSLREPQLPDYLKTREDEINRLLALTRLRDPTQEEVESLQYILYGHEPPHIKRLHDNVLRAQIKQDWASAGHHENWEPAERRLKKHIKSGLIL